MSEPSRITLWSDYGGHFLWDAAGGTDPAALGLSAALTSDLAEWQGIFNRFCDIDDGWGAWTTLERSYRESAPGLAQRIADELGQTFEVELVVSDDAGRTVRSIYSAT